MKMKNIEGDMRFLEVTEITEDIIHEIRTQLHGVNIIGDNVILKDMQAFLGPIRTKDIFIFLEKKMSMPQVMKMLGVFKSTSQAKKAGWEGEMPMGFTEFKKVSKFNLHICFLFLPDSKEKL